MLGDLEEDFPLNGGSDKLAKLFEENSLPDISFKFSVPKPPARTVKPFHNNVPLKVVYGKTVGAFQMKVDGYSSEGKLGLAIIGNDEYCYYQLYMYRSDERKVTSAEINFHFAFHIQEHNYATFRDTHNIQWSVHFEKPADLIAFSKEVALARWRSSQVCQTKLIQEAFKGKTDLIAKTNDTIRVKYNIFVLSPENALQEESDGKSVTAPASASTWETNLIGACAKSRRFVIIPSHLSGSLDGPVPNGFHVMLDMEIEEITPPPTASVEPLPSLPVSSNSPQTSTEKKEDTDTLCGRMARIGYALPSLQNAENDLNISLPEKPKAVPNKTLASISTSSSHSAISRDDPPTPMIESCDMTTSSQFNVLFSEVRTSNSEIRMNLNRVTDKVDSLLNKMEFLPLFNQKVLPAVEKFQNVDSAINKLIDQSNAIMTILGTNSPAQLEAALNEVMNLKKRNAELESFLEVSRSTCQILQDKIVELNQKISESEHSRFAPENVLCSLCQGLGERKIKNLESSIKNLQERNYALLEATEHLERQNRELSEHASLNLETKLRAQLGEKELKIVQLEREMNKMHLKMKKNSDKEMFDLELTHAIKGMMNKTYRVLKEGLKDSVKDGVQLEFLLARILKEATGEYLESIKLHHKLYRVEEESSESLDEIPRREEASEQGNPCFSPSLTPLPVPRPRKPLPPTKTQHTELPISESLSTVLQPQPVPIPKPMLPITPNVLEQNSNSINHENKCHSIDKNEEPKPNALKVNTLEAAKNNVPKLEICKEILKQKNIISDDDVPSQSLPNLIEKTEQSGCSVSVSDENKSHSIVTNDKPNQNVSEVKNSVPSVSDENKSHLIVTNDKPNQNVSEAKSFVPQLEISKEKELIKSDDDVPSQSSNLNEKIKNSGSSKTENNSKNKTIISNKSMESYSSYYTPFIPTTPPPLTDDYSDESEES